MHELIKKASPSGTGEAERKEGHDNTELDSHAVDGIAPIGMAEAAECAKGFKPKIAIPYHFQGQKPEEFAAALKGSSIEVRILNWYPKAQAAR